MSHNWVNLLCGWAGWTNGWQKRQAGLDICTAQTLKCLQVCCTCVYHLVYQKAMFVTWKRKYCTHIQCNKSFKISLYLLFWNCSFMVTHKINFLYPGDGLLICTPVIYKGLHSTMSINPAGKNSLAQHQNTTYAGDNSLARPTYDVFCCWFWCWSMLFLSAGILAEWESLLSLKTILKYMPW